MTFSGDGEFQGGRVRRGGGRGAVIAGGGGVIGLIVLALSLFTGQDLTGLVGTGPGPAQPAGNLVDSCTVEQANTDPACRLDQTIQALDAYWESELPTASGVQLVRPEVEAFEGGTSTACGAASSASGPFYCPPDQTVYIDLSFFSTLQQQFGAQGGPLAEMYVYAHEYGHHVQNLTGVFDKADRSGGGAESDSVRVELQADCYAGMWAGAATQTLRPGTDTPYLEPITAEELAQALDAAAAVGDDHIQEQSGGGVDPDSWTHGSSEQRQRWFTTGYQQGTLAACDTFAADTL